MRNSEPNRIVIRRKRVAAPGHHAGAWKIAYADYMTAMMAFFLIMWILSLVPKQDLAEIARYFRTPLMTAITGGAKVDSSTSVIPGGSPSVIPNKNPILQKPAPDGESERRDIRRLENLKSELESLIQVNPVLRQFRPQLLLDMTPDGLQIQIVDHKNRPMFTTGSAQVQPYMREILRELGPVFNKLPNAITISGHTDAMQYASGERQYSNWELSADRANAARKELVAGGMLDQKTKRVLGLSSSVSLIKDNPNAAVNRRISLLVLNQRAERRIDEQNAAVTSNLKLQQVEDAVPLLTAPPSSGDINEPAKQVDVPSSVIPAESGESMPSP